MTKKYDKAGDELSYADGYMYFTSNYRDKIHLYQLKVE